RAAAALLQPGVPGGADVGPPSHLLAAQAGRAAAFGREAEGAGVEPGAAVLQIGPEQGLRRAALAHPLSFYTMIRSRLYQDTSVAEDCRLSFFPGDFDMRVFLTGASGF